MKDINDIWNKHSYLYKCHITPKAFDGCNCEANLVLLCRQCHRESPDTRDPNLFITWIRNRKNFLKRNDIEIGQAMEDLGYKECDGDFELLMSQEFKNYCYENTLLVGGRLSAASLLASFIEFKGIKKLYNHKEFNLAYATARNGL